MATPQHDTSIAVVTYDMTWLYRKSHHAANSSLPLHALGVSHMSWLLADSDDIPNCSAWQLRGLTNARQILRQVWCDAAVVL